jgi:two-component system sensor histidine kinase BaeS
VTRFRPLPLALRLAAAFLAVAVTAVGVLAAFTILSARREVSALVDRQHRADAEAAAAAAADAYAAAGGWERASLIAAGALALRSDARLVVRSAEGRTVAVPTDAMGSMHARMHGTAEVTGTGDLVVSAPVVVEGRQVGDVTLIFATDGLPAPERQVRDAMWRSAFAGTAVAAAVALAVALFVAARMTRPLGALTTAARRLAAGDRSARAEVGGAPGELGALGAAFDQMAANLQQEGELRSKLITDVAHELRTPLTILRGQTEALVDGVTEADAASLGSLHEEVLRLTRLVGDLETLAAADAAGLQLVREPVDLADVAAGSVASVRSGADTHSPPFALELEHAPAVGDPGRLHQIALNLLSNAAKFTPGSGTITVRTWSDAAGSHLQVADTGPGFADGEVEHVFDRFWQGAAGRRLGGSGVGLSVAAELAAAHDGTLEAENREGGGASFTLTLRASRAGGTGRTARPR